jgi:IS5 family transposase
MIIDRHDPVCLFGLVPQLTLAMDPELAQLDGLLDDDPLFQQVKADFARRARHSLSRGRHSTPVEVILRMIVVRRLYDWSYEQTERQVADSLVLRQFCRVYLQDVPDDSTLIRWAGDLRPETLVALNDRVVALAVQARVTRGRKLRNDGTVVETTVHPPTDSSLLSDGVRVLSRLVKRAKTVVGEAPSATTALFRDRTRAAKRFARRIGEALRRRGEGIEQVRQEAYQHLLKVAEASLEQASRVQGMLWESGEETSTVGKELAHFIPLVEQVVDQTVRRVFGGETVPAPEKLVSLFEPHTAIIRRRKESRETEFGRKVWLAEVEGGIISSYRLLSGNPPDVSQFAPTLATHRRLFGRPPDLVAVDRGVYSAANERLAKEAGVKRVALPKPGHHTKERDAYERQRWFRRAMRFRAGCEGRISVGKRRGWLGRCRDKGEDGFGRWIGWGVLTANLVMISRHLAANATG